jgi:hypothetical protein
MLHDGLQSVAAGKDPLGVLREDRPVIRFDASMHELETLG